MDSTKNVTLGITLLIIILFIGTIGYSVIQKWDLLDSLYMTIITITTVGFGEVSEMGVPGKLFTIGLIASGVGIAAYIVGSLSRMMVEGEIRAILGRRKLEKQIQTLTNHYIICGCGRIGSLVCKEFATFTKPLPFVVIEKDPEVIEKIEEDNYLYVQGNSTEEDVLLKAGLKRAKGLVTAVSSDSDNVYITLTARELNPELFILARASDEGAEKKLLRAGADKVISPYHIGGRRMAQAILRPAVVDFLELAVHNKNMELQLEEIKVKRASQFVGVSLKDSGIRQNLGLIIVAIKKPTGDMVFNPSPESTIELGDTVLALGEKKNLVDMEKIMDA
ncbi:MAG: NAD-binding protein [Thermodesulfobacteriota bacterium]|nr:NAD-binding protein [Thermodesulfobacteriota bacterium]